MPNSNPLLSAHCFSDNSLHNPTPTQLNGEVWSKIETAVKPFKTFDTDTVTGSFNDSGVVGVEATLSSAYLDSKQRDYACTSFYALGGGALPLALPKALQDYASPSPYIFTGDLTLTFKDSDLCNISSVPISPLITVNDAINPVLEPEILFGSFTFDKLLVVSSSRDSNVCSERYGAVGYSSSNVLTFSLLKPQYTIAQTFEVDVSIDLGSIDTFYNLTPCSLVWLNVNTCVFGIQGQNTVYLITISVDNVTLTVTPLYGSEILYISENKDSIFSNDSILISRYDAVSGFKIYAISDFGEQLLYTGDGVFVGFYKTSDFTAIATRDLLNNSVIIKILQNWVNPCSSIISSDLTSSLGTNWSSHGAIVYEGIVYFLLISADGAIALLRVSDGYIIKSKIWNDPFSLGSILKVVVGASGILVLGSDFSRILRYENDLREGILFPSNYGLGTITGAFVFNGIAYYVNNLSARALGTFDNITIHTYFRCIRNIQQTPFATDYTNISSSNPGWVVSVYVGFGNYYSFDLTPYIQGNSFTAFSGFIRRGDKLYGVFLKSKRWKGDGAGSLSHYPLIVEASELTYDSVSGLNLDNVVVWSQNFNFEYSLTFYDANNVSYTEDKFKVITTLVDSLSIQYKVLGYANIHLGHSKEWLQNRLAYAKDGALVSGDKYFAERFTSFDLPIIGMYRLNNSDNVIFEHFIPCIDSQTLSLHSDLTVDETQFEGKWTTVENAGERSLSSLSPRMNILANQSMFLGIVNIYDTLTPNVYLVLNPLPPT